MSSYIALQEQLEEILDHSKFFLSDLPPSTWTELNRVMTTDVSNVVGPFSYSYTPYLREIIDCLSPNHPSRIIAVMKGAQIGFSAGVIESAIGWIISQNPGNILMLTGHSDLSEEAMKKVDQMIDSCGLRPMIRASTQRSKNKRTGDTNRIKEFPGGSLVTGSATNHKLLRQRSVKFGFIDDFDAAKKSSKESGNTRRLIEQRFAAYYDKMKLFYISTPELKQTSNIEPVFMLGDQRRYKVPCPCCSEFISLHWEITGATGDKAGITWKLDEHGAVDPETVGYICQKCGEFFDDSRKTELLAKGFWEATAEPSEVGYYSYHISALYAPAGMYDWTYYVRQYLEANPPGGQRDEKLHQTFVNLSLGESYEQKGKTPEAIAIQKNIREYQPGIVPEQMSIDDGNGKIMMLTCACDLNGKEEDARLDYEIVGWSASGSSYSITHGSIGTFIPGESQKKDKVKRDKWTYSHNVSNSIWPLLEELLGSQFKSDTGRNFKILFSGIDTGHHTEYAYSFLNKTKFNCVGLKGNKASEYRKFNIDIPIFKQSVERTKLFILDVNHIKDKISSKMDLVWMGGTQPPEFMNYPRTDGTLYQLENYFEHYESEHRIIESKDGEGIAARWEKKKSNLQNHMWDVYVYNYAVREIWAALVLSMSDMKKGTWQDYVALYLANHD